MYLIMQVVKLFPMYLIIPNSLRCLLVLRRNGTTQKKSVNNKRMRRESVFSHFSLFKCLFRVWGFRQLNIYN